MLPSSFSPFYPFSRLIRLILSSLFISVYTSHHKNHSLPDVHDMLPPSDGMVTDLFYPVLLNLTFARVEMAL